MKRTIIGFALLAASANVSANWCNGGWSGDDTARQAVFGFTQAVDWRYTRKIYQNPQQWREVGPAGAILGDNPRARDIDRYFAGVFLINTGIACALSPKARKVWQELSTGGARIYIDQNARIGIELDL